MYMKLHILTDNRAKKRGILAEHGLSLFIEHENANILFDTGQSDVYLRNAARMGVELDKTDCIVLSHGHYDHCGGLPCFPVSEQFPKTYVHTAAFARRYALSPDGTTYRDIGIPWSCDEYENIKNALVFTAEYTQIAPGVHLLGEIPGTAEFEDISPGFYCGNEADKAPDLMMDEQMLVCDAEKGLFVFLGCSHPGVVNCLNDVMKLFPDKKLHTLVAGMHLDHVSPPRLQMTIQHMIDLDIRRVIPLHCTGIFAICEMKRRLGNRCLALCAGDSLEL